MALSRLGSDCFCFLEGTIRSDINAPVSAESISLDSSGSIYHRPVPRGGGSMGAHEPPFLEHQFLTYSFGIVYRFAVKKKFFKQF